MTIEEIVDKVYVPEPLIKAEQAHKSSIREEMQKPVFGEILNRAIALRKERNGQAGDNGCTR